MKLKKFLGKALAIGAVTVAAMALSAVSAFAASTTKNSTTVDKDTAFNSTTTTLWDLTIEETEKNGRTDTFVGEGSTEDELTAVHAGKAVSTNISDDYVSDNTGVKIIKSKIDSSETAIFGLKLNANTKLTANRLEIPVIAGDVVYVYCCSSTNSNSGYISAWEAETGTANFKVGNEIARENCTGSSDYDVSEFVVSIPNDAEYEKILVVADKLGSSTEQNNMCVFAVARVRGGSGSTDPSLTITRTAANAISATIAISTSKNITSIVAMNTEGKTCDIKNIGVDSMDNPTTFTFTATFDDSDTLEDSKIILNYGTDESAEYDLSEYTFEE